jgi:hypothetical protein
MSDAETRKAFIRYHYLCFYSFSLVVYYPAIEIPSRTKHENRRNPRNEGCNNATTRSSSLSSQLGYRDMSQRQSSCHRLIAVSSFHDNTLVHGFAQHGAVASPIFYPPAAGKNPYTSLLFAGTLKALNPFIARAMSDMNATNVVANRIPMEGAKEGSDNLEDQKPSVTEMMKSFWQVPRESAETTH